MKIVPSEFEHGRVYFKQFGAERVKRNSCHITAFLTLITSTTGKCILTPKHRSLYFLHNHEYDAGKLRLVYILMYDPTRDHDSSCAGIYKTNWLLKSTGNSLMDGNVSVQRVHLFVHVFVLIISSHFILTSSNFNYIFRKRFWLIVWILRRF